MRPTREKSKQTDKGFDFDRIWEFLREESPAGVERPTEERAHQDGQDRRRGRDGA